ncbi:MAG: hypothetical protein OER98_05515 [Gammaproteobacteria bacterium]|nr:hypothetical protein [Gammaproteobacteria bacterium]
MPLLTMRISIRALFIMLATRDLDPHLFWVDGKGKVTCYESARDFALAPVSLSYPVPCRDLDWQQ